jgi:hypothetical protein
MLQRLFGMLVSGLVIFFPVVRGGSPVRVCGEFVEFGSFIVRLIWHNVSYRNTPFSLESFHFPNCPIMGTRAELAAFTRPIHQDSNLSPPN